MKLMPKETENLFIIASGVWGEEEITRKLLTGKLDTDIWLDFEFNVSDVKECKKEKNRIDRAKNISFLLKTNPKRHGK